MNKAATSLEKDTAIELANGAKNGKTESIQPANFTEEPKQTEAIVPEIDNLEEEEIGTAVLKEIIPGSYYYDYQEILNNKKKNAVDAAERLRAIYEAQVWLLCQVYEIVEPNGKRRPLGMQDVSCIEGEQLAFAIGELMTVDVPINYLDGTEDLEHTRHFEIPDKCQRFRVKKLSVEKGIEVQTKSQDDPSGIKLNKWLITQRITLNDRPITDEMFEEELDFESTVILSSKINFLLEQSRPKKTSFVIRSTATGRTAT